MSQIKPGDHVYHAPSGETWIVAYVDADRDELSWCGWPEGTAHLSDCRLVKSVLDKHSQEVIAQWIAGVQRDRGGWDSRTLTARRL